MKYTRRFMMFCVITNIYNKKTERPALMEFFTATGKLNIFFSFFSFLFLQLEMFDVCTTGDTAHIDMTFKFLPHTPQHVDACVSRTYVVNLVAHCDTRFTTYTRYMYCCQNTGTDRQNFKIFVLNF